MIENFESIVKEIDEMLMFREIDKLIKKHEGKKIQKKEIKTDLACHISIKPKNDTKEEIFELPVRKVKTIIELT